MTLQAGFEPLLKSISGGDLNGLKHLLNTEQYSVNEEIRYYSEDDKNYIITPLYWAVKLNQKEMCGYLLKRGADPYMHMVYEFYPLHEACNSGNCGIVQEFVKNKCNLNKKNCDGDTPLHIACLRGHTRCIQLLLAAGASKFERNNKGQTPLQVAQFDQQKELYELFNTDLSSSPLTSVTRTQPVAHPPLNRISSLAGNTIPPARRRSLTNHCQKQQPRPLSYHSTTQDCFNVGNNQRIKSLRSDITRTFSFSGTNNSAAVAQRLKDSNIHNEIKKDPNSLSPSRKPHRPSLSYMSHDSQLVLPTQKLVPDPRRTKTCHEFINLPFNDSVSNSTQVKPSTTSPEPPLTPDDIEVDGRPSNNLMGGRIRVNHMVQCMHPVLKSRDVTSDGTADVHSDCLLKVLYSIHREIGFTEDEYSAINRLIIERECDKDDRPMTNHDQRSMPGLEYVWGCDYDLVEPRRPLQVVKDSTMIDHLEMTFHVQLDSTQASKKDKDSVLKVLVQLLNLDDKDQFNDYINHQVLLCREGQIMSTIPPHPNIVKKFHHCLANSRPFERFTRHLCSSTGQQTMKLSSQCSLLFTDYFPTTLKDVFSHSADALSSATASSIQYQCITEQSLLIYISQLLLAVLHLERHSIILGYISPSKVFTEHSDLYFADFAFAFDLTDRETDPSIMTNLKEWLVTVPRDRLLDFPPELYKMLNSLSLQAEGGDSSLDKCNVYCVGKLFNKLLMSDIHQSSGTCFINISDQMQFLLKNLVSDSVDERFSCIDALMYCLALRFGPVYSKCNTIESCQEWLMTETFHLFLQPSLKGHPTSYPANVHTKLLFTYLCIATPEKLLLTMKRISQLTNPVTGMQE